MVIVVVSTMALRRSGVWSEASSAGCCSGGAAPAPASATTVTRQCVPSPGCTLSRVRVACGPKAPCREDAALSGSRSLVATLRLWVPLSGPFAAGIPSEHRPDQQLPVGRRSLAMSPPGAGHPVAGLVPSCGVTIEFPALLRSYGVMPSIAATYTGVRQRTSAHTSAQPVTKVVVIVAECRGYPVAMSWSSWRNVAVTPLFSAVLQP